MKAKVCYHVFSGTVSKTTKPFVYQFAKTSGIQMKVSKTGFSVKVNRTVAKEPELFLQDNLFRDAIKKVYLIQLIRYGAMSNGPIYAEVGEIRVCLCDGGSNNNMIYSLCGNKLLRQMSKNWADSSIQRILDVTKSKASHRDASLDALLMAKSKRYETERFIYLWMSMNGLYGDVAKEAEPYLESKREIDWLKREYAQIKFFAMILGYPYRGVKDDHQNYTMIRQLEYLLTGVNKNQIEEMIIALKADDTNNAIINEMHLVFEEAGIPRGKMHPYAALLLYMSYKIRCKYYHAEKPLPLMCFENEHPLPVLRVLNAVMEDYLDNNMHLWFDEHYRETVYIPKIQQYASNCHCKNQYLSSCVIDGEEKA